MIETMEAEKASLLRTGESNNLGVVQLLTIKQFCSRFPWPSESAMRSYIYRAKLLGLEEAFVRLRRRVLIDANKFFELVKQLNSRSNQGGLYETTQYPEKRKNRF